jgi:hypothetical protein
LYYLEKSGADLPAPLLVLIALAQRQPLRLHRLPPRHRRLGFVGEREERDLDDDDDGENRQAEVAKEADR